MSKKWMSTFILIFVLCGSVAEARVGGGRSFGSRGSRGFTSPGSFRSAPSRSYDAPRSTPSSPGSSYSNTMPSQKASFLKAMGAGIAGGVLGGLLFRALGGNASFPMQGAGIGLFEVLVVGGLLFLLFRLLRSRAEVSPSVSGATDATSLMRQARPQGWSQEGSSFESNGSYGELSGSSSESIDKELAMDLFFKVQGAWASRELSQIDSILDEDVKSYLNREVMYLKTNRRVNRLENIAVRGVDIVESWNELGKEFSTVRFSANLLDYTIDEVTQEVLEGDQKNPIKFEEYWTFVQDANSSRWKLSAIQQS